MKVKEELALLKWVEKEVSNNREEPITEREFWTLTEQNLAIYFPEEEQCES